MWRLAIYFLLFIAAIVIIKVMVEAASVKVQLSFAPIFKVLIAVGKENPYMWIRVFILAKFYVLDNVGLLQECDVEVFWKWIFISKVFFVICFVEQRFLK